METFGDKVGEEFMGARVVEDVEEKVMAVLLGLSLIPCPESQADCR